MAKPPDSRVSAGQALEDEADAITDSVRRDTVAWSRRMMRGHPNNPRIRAAFAAGLIGGAMDLLGEVLGDYSAAAQAIELNVAAYLATMADDAELDAQPQTKNH